jgi:hypothetical protein
MKGKVLIMKEVDPETLPPILLKVPKSPKDAGFAFLIFRGRKSTIGKRSLWSRDMS